jgi:hypothetical protein
MRVAGVRRVKNGSVWCGAAIVCCCLREERGAAAAPGGGGGGGGGGERGDDRRERARGQQGLIVAITKRLEGERRFLALYI